MPSTGSQTPGSLGAGLFPSPVEAHPGIDAYLGDNVCELHGDCHDLQLTHLDSARDRVTGRRSRSKRVSPGVFATGGVRSGSINRVASAVGEGATTVRVIHQWRIFRHR